MNGDALEDALRLGRDYIGTGRYAEAADLMSRAMPRASESAELHAVLGSALMGLGRYPEAERSFAEAARLRPSYVEVLNDLGNSMRLQGKLRDAVAKYREALLVRPEIGQIHQNLGTALADLRMLAEAELSLRQAVRLQPARAEAVHDLGVLLQKRGDALEAAQCFRQALQLKPSLVASRLGLARCCAMQGDAAEAIALCEQVMEAEPGSPEALVTLGSILQAQGKLEEAAERYRAALKISADSVDATYQLATVFMARNQLDEAEAGFRKVLQLAPTHALAANNLGNVYLARAMPEEAIKWFERAQHLQPDFAGAYSNVLFALNFCADATPEQIRDAHFEWGERHAAPLARPQVDARSRDPDRRLRVGYVSGDFRAHSVSLFIEPVLRSHNRSAFEVFCYSDVSVPDEVTARLMSLPDRWISLSGMSDERAADTIRRYQIDILVDLAGHTGPNRMLAFARRPAPLQATWLGYPNTTGMKAMDYRITDAFADPPGMTERYFSEKLVRMPDSLWCYRADGNAPPVSELPAAANGFVTFGSFNNFAKVTRWTRALWSRLLAAIPGSRLLIVGVPEGGIRAQLESEFRSAGIEPSRISLAPRLSRRDFFERHRLVDIALDPWPFEGGTTTCESLWMGVPVISMAGNRFAARAGVSLLSSVSLGNLVARDPDDYIAVAGSLARDLRRLGALRQELRERMTRSPLTQAPRFVANLERLYRYMWRNWCFETRM